MDTEEYVMILTTEQYQMFLDVCASTESTFLLDLRKRIQKQAAFYLVELPRVDFCYTLYLIEKGVCDRSLVKRLTTLGASQDMRFNQFYSQFQKDMSKCQ